MDATPRRSARRTAAGALVTLAAVLAWTLIGAVPGQAAVTGDANPSARGTASTVHDSTGSTAPRPVVSGNHLVDSRTGATWTPHGVNWPSFEYACQQGWAESADGATPAAAAAMVSWGITAVRIPLNQDCWLGVDHAPAFGTAASYQAALSSWVSILNNAGLVVILDLHWTSPTGFAADGQRAMPDAQSVTFWSQLAGVYRSSPSVLLETFNEPYSRGSYPVSWSCWRDGGCIVPSSNDASPIGTATYTAHGMAEIVAAIRAAGAAQPILLDGLNYANDLTGWLANRPSDSQLVASWHNYPGQGCSDTTCWNSQVVPVSATVPVIASEFGMTTSDPSFINGFMAWADAHQIGYAPWAWWYTDSSDGAAANLYALISNLTTFTPRAPEGTAYHDHLAAISTPTTPPAPLKHFRSFSGHGTTDVLARTAPGAFLDYVGDGHGGLAAPVTIGNGFSSLTAIVLVNDFDGDGLPDLLIRNSAGQFLLYRGNGAGGWGTISVVGSGWGPFNTLFSPGDFDGDGNNDVIAGDSSGALYLYRGTGHGGWIGGANRIGSGWNIFNRITSTGDLDGDGITDVIASTPAGLLYVYRGNGHGGWNGGANLISSGWSGYTLVPAGDFDGDGVNDLLARDSAGQLWLYPGTGHDGWSAHRLVSGGWSFTPSPSKSPAGTSV